MANPDTPGKDTSEWRAWVLAICAALAVATGSILGSGLILDTAGFGLYEGLVMAVTILSAIAGITVPTTAYIKGRSQLKATKIAAAAGAEAAKAAVDPTQG